MHRMDSEERRDERASARCAGGSRQDPEQQQDVRDVEQEIHAVHHSGVQAEQLTSRSRDTHVSGCQL